MAGIRVTSAIIVCKTYHAMRAYLTYARVFPAEVELLMVGPTGWVTGRVYWGRRSEVCQEDLDAVLGARPQTGRLEHLLRLVFQMHIAGYQECPPTVINCQERILIYLFRNGVEILGSFLETFHKLPHSDVEIAVVHNIFGPHEIGRIASLGSLDNKGLFAHGLHEPEFVKDIAQGTPWHIRVYYYHPKRYATDNPPDLAQKVLASSDGSCIYQVELVVFENSLKLIPYLRDNGRHVRSQSCHEKACPRSPRDRSGVWITVGGVVQYHLLLPSEWFLATGIFLYGPGVFLWATILPASRSIFT